MQDQSPSCISQGMWDEREEESNTEWSKFRVGFDSYLKWSKGFCNGHVGMKQKEPHYKKYTIGEEWGPMESRNTEQLFQSEMFYH